MRILIIGGSQFIGKILLEKLCLDSKEHNVYVFNRGNHGIDAKFNVIRIIGDRLKGFEELKYIKFDIVFDTCGYKPTDFKHISQLNFDSYVFVSSTAVYEVSQKIEIDESSPIRNIDNLRNLTDAEIQDLNVDSSNYGSLKILCEEKLQAIRSRVVVVRPCVVLGKYENTGRLRKWFELIGNSETIQSPKNRDLVFQFIDVRDLAKLMIDIALADYQGVFNLCAPPISWESFVNASIMLKPESQLREPVLADSSTVFLDYSKRFNGSYFKSKSKVVSTHNFYEIYETLQSFF